MHLGCTVLSYFPLSFCPTDTFFNRHRRDNDTVLRIQGVPDFIRSANFSAVALQMFEETCCNRRIDVAVVRVHEPYVARCELANPLKTVQGFVRIAMRGDAEKGDWC